MLTFSRQLELQADRLAAATMAAAGYDPEAAIQYLEAQPPTRQASVLFSARTTSSQRINAIRSAVANLPARTYSVGFDQAKALAGSVH